MKQVLIVVFVALFLSSPNFVFGADTTEQSRPGNVPSSANWVGGPDGGVWVLLKYSSGDTTGSYYAEVYHQNGQLEYKGRLVLQPTSIKSSATDLRTLAREIQGWDGDELLLSEGRSLKVP